MVRGSQVAIKHVIHDMVTRTLLMELRRRVIKRWVPCGDMDRRLKIHHLAKVECGFRTTPEECLYDSGLIGHQYRASYTIPYNTIQYNTLHYIQIELTRTIFVTYIWNFNIVLDIIKLEYIIYIHNMNFTSIIRLEIIKLENAIEYPKLRNKMYMVFRFFFFIFIISALYK